MALYPCRMSIACALSTFLHVAIVRAAVHDVAMATRVAGPRCGYLERPRRATVAAKCMVATLVAGRDHTHIVGNLSEVEWCKRCTLQVARCGHARLSRFFLARVRKPNSMARGVKVEFTA